MGRKLFLTTVYFINRFPTPILGHQTSYELLYKEKPSYSHLRMFGCLCYASTLRRNRSKFNSKAVTCIFFSYPPGQKAYKLYDLEAKRVFVCRDVFFYDNYFPYARQEHQSLFPLPLSIGHDIDHFFHITIPSTHGQQQHSTEETQGTQDSSSFQPHSAIPSTLPSSSLQQETPSTSSHQPPPAPTETALPTKRSTRSHKPPPHFQDYC